ncbi:hypothetical protein C5167_033368 [Papaver somniferum]|uniref:Uncharacterized protein n=1 Tax=Papaver somniferum TaxID=3469 RepID=A0A4Y7KD10_PAPSO|nr:hypothetical protein C5167_033368 [Papaver somniferum]
MALATEKKWLFTLFSVAFLSLLLYISAISDFTTLRSSTSSTQFTAAESGVQYGLSTPPAFAYYISGGRGHKGRILRLLLAVYHPRNRYLLHLGTDASSQERDELALEVKGIPVVRSFGNVDVLGKPDPLTYMGSSNIAATLRAAAILLRVDAGWDWFITLSSNDYPLLTQDDLSHVFSTMSRDFNFIDHTSDLGWKEHQRVQPVVAHFSLYFEFYVVFASPYRSPWVTLSRSFVEFCVLGWDNLPRTLLMYFTNVILSQEGYFHSVICNSPEFQNTTINSDLRYMVWDNPPRMEPHFLNITNYDQMVQSGAAFARQFEKDDHVLNLIDRKILGRQSPYRATPGAWCAGKKSWWVDPCSKWGDLNVIKPGPGVKRFEESIVRMVSDEDSESNRCK